MDLVGILQQGPFDTLFCLFNYIWVCPKTRLTDYFEDLIAACAAANLAIGTLNLHVGICGEHGGDPTSVEFCHELGLDYVSCSPFRVPIARLAAAQAAIKSSK